MTIIVPLLTLAKSLPDKQRNQPQKAGNIVHLIYFGRQRNDVPAPAYSEVVPCIETCIDLERSPRLFAKRGKIPEIRTPPFYRLESETGKINSQRNRFGGPYVHLDTVRKMSSHRIRRDTASRSKAGSILPVTAISKSLPRISPLLSEEVLKRW